MASENSLGKNLAVGGLTLGAADYFSGGVVYRFCEKVASNISNVVAGGGITNTPMIGGLLPSIGLGAHALYKGAGEFKERGIWGMVEKASLRYGIPGTVLAAGGVASFPYVGTGALVGLGMYGTRHIWEAGKSIVADPLGIVGSLFQWPGKAFDMLKGRNSQS